MKLTRESFDCKSGHLDYKVIDECLKNQSVVEGLINFISFCQTMIDNYKSQLHSVDEKFDAFLQLQIKRYETERDDLVELINYRKKNSVYRR